METDFANHEGRSATFWDDQSRTNTATLNGLEKLHEKIAAESLATTNKISVESKRTDKIENKFSWVWGVAAGVSGFFALVIIALRYFL